MARVVPTMGQASPGNYETGAWWNQNVQALGQFLLNPPRFSGTLASTTFNIASSASTWTSVIIDTEAEDTDAGHSTTTNSQRYTCQVAGLYLVTGSVCFTANATGFRAAKFQVNGTDVPGSEQTLTTVTAALPATVAPTPSPVRMAVGDYVLMQAIQNTGANLALTTLGASQTRFDVRWIAA